MIADWILDTLENLGTKLLEKAQKRFPDPAKSPDAYMNSSSLPQSSYQITPEVDTQIPTKTHVTSLQQPAPQPTSVSTKVSSDTVVFRIKPFKDNEFSTAYRQ